MDWSILSMIPFPRFRIRTAGFTLAELLISLALLGVIAAFAIPKVMTQTANQQKYSVLKETLATLSEVIHTGRLSGELVPDNVYDYLKSHINVLKFCDTNSSGNGCWVLPDMGNSSSPDVGEPGFVLPNGAVVVGIHNFPRDVMDSTVGQNQWIDGFLVDWNGRGLPNRLGEDQLFLIPCYGPAACDSATVVTLAGRAYKSQEIGPILPTGTYSSIVGPGLENNQALYNAVMQ